MGIRFLSALVAFLGAAITLPCVAVEVAVAVAGRTAAGSSVSFEGRIEPIRQATVAAQVGGNVLALLVKAGDTVKVGQVLARIDERDAGAALARSDAAVAQADAEARQARVQVERARSLATQGFVSAAAVDSADSQWKSAQAGLQQAQASRSQAALVRGHTLVTAPFAGVVLATHVEGGDLATPGRAIVTLYEPGRLRAVVQIPLSRSAAAKEASKVEVEMPDGQRVAPENKALLSTADPVSQTVEWRLGLPASALGGAMPGQTVSVHLQSSSSGVAADRGSRAVTVPASALLRRGELEAVYIVQGDTFVLRAVRVASSAAAGSVDIVAGLRHGEKIAADAVQAGMSAARPAR